MSNVDSMLAHLENLLESGLTITQVMARTDPAEFAKAALDELKERGTYEILSIGSGMLPRP